MRRSAGKTVNKSCIVSDIIIDKDHEGARIGMWLFLFTELLLFGGMFLLYAVYRNQFPEDFHYCAANLNIAMGGLNTLILLTSSLTMVLAVVHLEKRNRKYSAIFLSVTLFFAFWFLVNLMVVCTSGFLGHNVTHYRRAKSRHNAPAPKTA